MNIRIVLLRIVSCYSYNDINIRNVQLFNVSGYSNNNINIRNVQLLSISGYSNLQLVYTALVTFDLPSNQQHIHTQNRGNMFNCEGPCIFLHIYFIIFIDLCFWLGDLVYLWIGGWRPCGSKTTRSSEHPHTKACKLDPELIGRWLCVFGGNVVNEYW